MVRISWISAGICLLVSLAVLDVAEVAFANQRIFDSVRLAFLDDDPEREHSEAAEARERSRSTRHEPEERDEHVERDRERDEPRERAEGRAKREREERVERDRERPRNARVDGLRRHLKSVVENRDRMIASMNHQIESIEKQLVEAERASKTAPDDKPGFGERESKRESFSVRTTVESADGIVEVEERAESREALRQRLREQRERAELSLKEQVGHFGEEHPMVRATRKKIEVLDRLVSDAGRIKQSVSRRRPKTGPRDDRESDRFSRIESEVDQLRESVHDIRAMLQKLERHLDER